jgi:hypothetical protein
VNENGASGDPNAKGPVTDLGLTRAQWWHLFEQLSWGLFVLGVLIIIVIKVLADSSAAYFFTFLTISIVMVFFNVEDVVRKKLRPITVVLWVGWVSWLLYGAMH